MQVSNPAERTIRKRGRPSLYIRAESRSAFIRSYKINIEQLLQYLPEDERKTIANMAMGNGLSSFYFIEFLLYRVKLLEERIHNLEKR